MVDFALTHAAWLVINLAVPIVLPFVAIFVVAIDAQNGKLLTLLKKSIENGQLFWTVISMLAATAYDAILALDTHPDMKASVWWTVGVCVLMSFISTMFVGIATIHSSNNRPANVPTIVMSVIATIIMCVFYPVVHFRFE